MQRRCALLLLCGWSVGCSRGASHAPSSTTPAWPGVVLYEVVTQTAQAVPDTLVTYVTAHAVRVEHASGAALLDFDAGRITILDASTRTFRSEALDTWQARIDAAMRALADSNAAAAPRFERAGGTLAIAGYTCERWVLYTHRNLLGTRENVEQQVWVTRELDLPPGAFAAYQRTLGTIESLGFATRAAYPEGVVLRRETRARPADASRRHAPAVEAGHVFRVESRPLPQTLFVVPQGYAPVRSTTAPPRER